MMKPENNGVGTSPTKVKRDALKRLEGIPRKRGRAELIKHVNGQSLSPRNAIFAKCNECMGYYMDGSVSCMMPLCPLFPFMPYKPKSC
jgi:hypothetical protein